MSLVAIFLVLPFKEISIWPELSSPPHFRILGRSPERDTWKESARKSLCLILNIGYSYLIDFAQYFFISNGLIDYKFCVQETELQSYQVTKLQTYKITNLTSYQVTRFLSYQVRSYQVTKLPCYQITKSPSYQDKLAIPCENIVPMQELKEGLFNKY